MSKNQPYNIDLLPPKMKEVYSQQARESAERYKRPEQPSKMDKMRAIRQGKIITAIPTQQTSLIPVPPSIPILGIEKEEKEIDYTKYIMGAAVLGFIWWKWF